MRIYKNPEPTPYWQIALHAGDSDYLNRIKNQEEAEAKKIAKEAKNPTTDTNNTKKVEKEKEC